MQQRNLYLALGRKLLGGGGNHFPYEDPLDTLTGSGNRSRRAAAGFGVIGGQRATDTLWAPCLEAFKGDEGGRLDGWKQPGWK